MISICIPIYNFNVKSLVNELSRQAKLLRIPYEIILIDDCSSYNYKVINKEVCEKEIYIELDKNIGRSRIRNLFRNYSKYENLLFLDCDSIIISDDFFSKYIDIIQQGNYDVICGGRVYNKNRPGKNKMLRWKYGIIKESQPLIIRNTSPNKSFMTSNFIISKRIFNQIGFDEKVTAYGHEDTLFGYRLKKAGIKIQHIDNFVMNGNIEDNIEFLKKTEIGIINLIKILRIVNYDRDFIKDVTLLEFYYKFESIKMTYIVQLIFICLKPIIRSILIKGYINLWLFDFYKLGILIQNRNQTSKIAE